MLNWTLMLYKWEKLGDKMEMLAGTHSAINAQYDIKKKKKNLTANVRNLSALLKIMVFYAMN